MDNNPWVEQYIPTRLDWIVLTTNSILSILFSKRKDFYFLSVKSDDNVGINCHIFQTSALEDDIKQEIEQTIEIMLNSIVSDHGWDSDDTLKTKIIYHIKDNKENQDLPQESK